MDPAPLMLIDYIRPIDGNDQKFEQPAYTVTALR